MISIVAAIGLNRVLGKDNQLLWHIPDDFKRFKQLTLGHPIIMGRKTFESILATLGKPLPGRTNIVITRDASRLNLDEGFTKPLIVSSIEEAIEKAKQAPGSDEIFIGGGGEIYRQSLPLVDKLYLTLIEDDKEGDSQFPEYEKEFTKIVFEESREHEGIKYMWVDLER
ncbi:MAG: hypothetical protein A2854_00230 [Parcubacteria group bacterium RIFCSPHIGHO2_01_FULL_56_18]|nr:MAG: hypothetical protein A2854_00230 [Parcubacteria group bacterium RIFCSPHIGHO2_01_FULL_56_18]